MKREELYDAITEVRDELVDEAARTAPARKPINWLKWAGIAAAATLALGVGGWWAANNLGGMSFSPGAGSGGGGHGDGSTVFTNYAGPVFPLTTLEGGESLEAERHVTYDFSPWTPAWRSNEDEANSRTGLSEEERQDVLDTYNEWYPEGGRFQSSADLLVTDSYTLTNPTAEDRTVTVLYPFVSSLYELGQDMPTLTAGSGKLNTVLRAGGYSGGFQGVPDGEGNVSEELLNLAQLNSWEQYKALLSDGRYQAAALEEYPDLSDTPVIVYKFTGYYGPEPDERAGYPNPSIRAGFDLDYDRTTVLSYGFHGMRWDEEAGTMIQKFSIPQPYNPWYGEPYYLFVIGDDIQNLTVGGYVTGGTDPDTTTLDGCGVNVERYATDLESALREAAELMYGKRERMADPDRPAQPDFELYFGLMKEFLLSYGILSENGVERYHTGWLEELDFVNVSRVFYLEAEVTIPAGERVTVQASFVKHPSYDHYCANTENKGVYGYDMVTKLGTNLNFTAQNVETVNTEAVEIVRQNYGFDWENGTSRVVLDPSVEHYYLEVRRTQTGTE